jgi:hypothetical protein
MANLFSHKTYKQGKIVHCGKCHHILEHGSCQYCIDIAHYYWYFHRSASMNSRHARSNSQMIVIFDKQYDG